MAALGSLGEMAGNWAKLSQLRLCKFRYWGFGFACFPPREWGAGFFLYRLSHWPKAAAPLSQPKQIYSFVLPWP